MNAEMLKSIAPLVVVMFVLIIGVLMVLQWKRARAGMPT